jgi:hypothetical protein
MKKIIFTLACIIGVLVYLNLPRSDKSFPSLSNGFYIGKLNVDNQEHVINLKVTSDNTYFISIADTDFLSEVIDRNFDNETNWLELIKNNQKIILYGQKDKSLEDTYSGEADLSYTDKVGLWNLRKISLSTFNQSMLNQKEVEVTMLLHDEYSRVSADLLNISEFNKKTLKDITEVSDFINNPEKLKNHAKERLEKINQTINQIKPEILELEKRVSKAEEQVALAYKLTQQGVLVEMSRESLSRESRWVESMFRTNGVSDLSDLRVAYEKAKEIQALKSLIYEEQDKIYLLENGQQQ